MQFQIPRGTTAVQGIPIGRLNNLELRVRALEAGGGGGGWQVETPSESVNDSRTTYTVSNTPKAVVVNGLLYFAGVGYTYSAPTITLANPVGTGGFIRSLY